MNSPHDPSGRLLDWARQAPREPLAEQAHPAFATRVLAQLRAGRAPPPWEALALGAVPVATVLAIACILLTPPANYATPDPEMLAQVMLETQLQDSP